MQHALHLGVHRVLGAAGDHVGCRRVLLTLVPTASPGGRLDSTMPLTASSIARYPVQRHRFPSAPVAGPASALGERRRGHDHPGGAEPHWNPGRHGTVAASGAGSRVCPSPSIVVTSRPSARKAGVMQLCTGSRSDPTVQATQSPRRTLLTPCQSADEGAQALAGDAAPPRTSCRSRCRSWPVPFPTSRRISSAKCLARWRRWLGVPFGSSNHTSGGSRVDAVLQRAGVRHGVEPEADRVGGARGDGQKEVVGIRALGRDHEDRGPAEVGVG